MAKTPVSTFTFGGMNNASDPATVGAPTYQNRTYSACADIVNCDVDSSGNVSRREGSAVDVEAAVTSAGLGFCVVDGAINAYSAGVLTPLVGSPAVADVTEFLQVNDIVVFSDDTTIGYIKDDLPTILSSSTEADDILDLEAWVASTYPAGAEVTESNMEIDAFAMSTRPGYCLEFYNGAVYMARQVTNDTGVAWFVFCTKTFNAAKEDDRFNVVAGFKDQITMIKAVNDGIFVGTLGGTFFLSGDGVKGSAEGIRGFTQRKLNSFGAIYGSAAKVPGKKEKGSEIVMWLTANGVYAGGDGGVCEDVSEDRALVPAGLTAAAFVRQTGDDWHYVVSIAGAALVVTLKTLHHSRYTGFSFNGFFSSGGHYYGTNADGVILLEGETDYAASAIDAYFSTPLTDFEAQELKRCADAYLQVRTSGDMALDLYVDEAEVAVDIPFDGPFQIETGLRHLRAKLPRGAKGSSWQFKIKNVDGCRFTAFSLKVPPVVSGRTI